MAYLKRQKVPKNWPIGRKGTTYVVNPGFNPTKGIPILVILRDLLGVAANRREAKRIIHAKQVLLNNKPVQDDKHNVLLLDCISIVPSNKFYRVALSDKGKFKLEEIKAEEAGRKISKVINKKTLRGKKTQLNLSDGRNFLSDLKCKVNDSVLINLLEKKLEKCVPLQEKAKVLVFEGKHAGEKGTIDKLKDKTAEIKMEDGTVDILIKQLMVVE